MKGNQKSKRETGGSCSYRTDNFPPTQRGRGAHFQKPCNGKKLDSNITRSYSCYISSFHSWQQIFKISSNKSVLHSTSTIAVSLSLIQRALVQSPIGLISKLKISPGFSLNCKKCQEIQATFVPRYELDDTIIQNNPSSIYGRRQSLALVSVQGRR